jgi:endonuclease/exonuclease/phosphatase (EEP) superfamily protein YafD
MAPNTTTNITFWNARGLGNKKLQLEEFLHSAEIDITGISESKFNLTSNQDYKNYNLLHHSNLGGAEGIAILSKRHLPYTELKININFPSPKVMACSYSMHNKHLIVIFIYSAPNKPLSTTVLKDILSQATATANRTINLGGDFNAQHAASGKATNRKGRAIMDFADEHNLVLLNDR